MKDFSDKVIGGQKFTVSTLSATDAFKLKAKVLKIIGPCLSDIKDSIKILSETDVEDDNDLALIESIAPVIGQVIANLAESLDPDVFVDTLTEICEHAVVGNQQVQFDVDFSGIKMTNAYQVAALVLSHNFGFFFEGVSQKVKGNPKLAGLMKAQSNE